MRVVPGRQLSVEFPFAAEFPQEFPCAALIPGSHFGYLLSTQSWGMRVAACRNRRRTDWNKGIILKDNCTLVRQIPWCFGLGHLAGWPAPLTSAAFPVFYPGVSSMWTSLHFRGCSTVF